MNNFGQQRQESVEYSLENSESTELKKSLLEFLKLKGVDPIFVPDVQINDKGYLSVSISENGKTVFNGYSTPEPFSIGKEKIIEGAKEAIGYWIESQLPVLEDMNEIRDHTIDQLKKVKENVTNDTRYTV